MGNASVVTKFILLGIPHTEDLETTLFVLFLGCYVFTLMGNLLILLAILACADTSALEMVGFVSVGLMPVSCFLLILTSYSRIVCSILQIRSTEGRRRVFSTCSAHLTAILLSFMPVVLIYLQPTPNPWLNATVQVLNNLVTPMLNPLIYSLRNKEVKYSLRKVLQQVAFLPEQ
ncbi:olfactory receptor 149-like [Puma concolor]|uniref:Olfactory receptor 149-like n=1 Tax=Puma concolor TaxID=9696 RepID=A0A6P6I951_PUMCO|nr:olfactory receptor 149-like [Puma concolor]